MSRRTAYGAVSAVLAALSLSVIALPALAQARATAHAAAATVNVTAMEFKFKLSTKSVKHGKVTFKITNNGAVQHDFSIDGVKSKLIASHKTTSISVDFKKKGNYSYMCTVPGHAAAGMKGTLKVT
jgi:uncharacterized cupredoxin-like copper-binding protein